MKKTATVRLYLAAALFAALIQPLFFAFFFGMEKTVWFYSLWSWTGLTTTAMVAGETVGLYMARQWTGRFGIFLARWVGAALAGLVSSLVYHLTFVVATKSFVGFTSNTFTVIMMIGLFTAMTVNWLIIIVFGRQALVE